MIIYSKTVGISPSETKTKHMHILGCWNDEDLSLFLTSKMPHFIIIISQITGLYLGSLTCLKGKGIQLEFHGARASLQTSWQA